MMNGYQMIMTKKMSEKVNKKYKIERKIFQSKIHLRNLHPAPPVHRLAASAAATAAAANNTALRTTIICDFVDCRRTTNSHTILLQFSIILFASRHRRLDVMIFPNQLI